jgi:hypothetical protein
MNKGDSDGARIKTDLHGMVPKGQLDVQTVQLRVSEQALE